jgi:hypothetical protein
MPRMPIICWGSWGMCCCMRRRRMPTPGHNGLLDILYQRD